jgi:aminoglycoside phosphotransferase (APT) family kinase protein
MTAAAVTGAPLVDAVVRRSPLVADALDEQQALARARAWAARAAPDAVVEGVRVRSALYRPDGSCTLRYLVRLAPGGREQVLLVGVPPSAGDVVVRPFPDDPGLPTLPLALDPVLMREVLGRAVPGTGGDRAVARCAVEVVRHPRQGRCVLRYGLRPGAGGAAELRHPVVFGKVYADATAAATAAAALRALRRGLPAPRGVRVPEPLAVVTPLRLGLTEAVPGRPAIADLVRAACAGGGPGIPVPPALRQAVRTAAGVAAAVHACAAPRTPLGSRDLAGELAATERALRLLEPLWGEVAERLRRGASRPSAGLVDGAGPAARDREPLAAVVAHGDLTPGQVLLDGAGGAGLVDVDTLCRGEPALDLGRFLAYLHVGIVRRSRTAEPLLAEVTRDVLEAYLDAAPGGPPSGGDGLRSLVARTAAYRAAALARLGASACWQLKDDRLRAVLDLLDAGDAWTERVTG